MKKRTGTLLFAVLFALSSLVGMAGCGGPGPGEDPGQEPGGQEPGGQDPEPVVPDEDAPAYAQADATLTLTGAIDKTSAENRISADLFGLFLEDINFASFALDDNMIVNGSFESVQTNLSGGRLYGWTSNGVSLSADTQHALLADNADFRERDGDTVNPSVAKVSATAGGSISNAGHEAAPIAVREGTDYVFSAFLLPDGYTGTVAAEITDGTDIYASSQFEVTGEEWIKYRRTLTASATKDENLMLRITFGGSGTLYLDGVKLETTDATVGFKTYMFEAIEELSPAFFRFPGGCIIEGTNDSSYFDWKNSIGAVASADGDKVPAFTYTLNDDGNVTEQTTYGEQVTRTYNANIWGFNGQNGTAYYQMEYGIGFYEYFLLCEALGAKAIPIVNCGLSCQVQTAGGARALSGRHGNGVNDFIRDALDLIAFAKGDPASSDPNEAYWAQVRVNMGHEEPFDMDYIGIGNEQWGNYYTDYYEKFLEAFAAQTNPLYASVTPIVGNCTMFQNCEDPEENRTGAAQEAAESYMRSGKIDAVSEYGVHDQHYYVNYTDLFLNADLYDGYARPADDPEHYYEVFVGEYAANAQAVRSPVANDAQIFANVDNSWINALSEAAMMTGFERNGDIVKLAAYAPMFGNLLRPSEAAGEHHWVVNMMFFDGTDVLRTPNYYVQQLFMQNSGDYKVASELSFAAETPTVTFRGNGSLSRTADAIYYVVSADEETGDIIVKIVNAGETEVRCNVSLAGLEGVRLAGTAEVREVIGFSYDSTNSLDVAWVLPEESYVIGAFTGGNCFGYAVQPLSVTAIRIHTEG